ncbi:MAG: hypothetical protein LAT82_03835 [Nanoarchaeota archaeon]|nr:hypothetical protein [Nanoarchaeota archaeon]
MDIINKNSTSSFKFKFKSVFITLLISLVFIMTINSSYAYNFQILSTNPAPIEAGKYADITIRIDFPLMGGESREINPVTFYIKETQDIRPVFGQEFNLLSARSGQSVTRTFRVYFSDSIPTGEIPLTLVAQSGLNKVELTDTIFIQRAPRDVDLLVASIQTTPQNLIQDSKSNVLTFTIQNLGERNAEMITATLRSESSELENIIEESFFFSMQDSVAQIQGGGQGELTFTIDIEETQHTKIPMTLDFTYRVRNPLDNSYTRIEQSLPIELRLRNTPRFNIVSIEPENTLTAGTNNNKIRVIVENVGEEEGTSVRLRLYPDPSAPFDFERTTLFISSSLKPNEKAEFIIPFDVLDTALIQSYFVNADIESLVGSSRFEQSLRVEIPVEQEATDGLGIYLVILLILTIGGSIIIGYFYSRSNIKNKESK